MDDDLQKMADTLKANGWTVSPPISQETCPHPLHMRMGSGSCGSDGSSSWSWSCRRCGKSESGKTPPRALPVDNWLMQVGRN